MADTNNYRRSRPWKGLEILATTAMKDTAGRTVQIGTTVETTPKIPSSPPTLSPTMPPTPIRPNKREPPTAPFEVPTQKTHKRPRCKKPNGLPEGVSYNTLSSNCGRKRGDHHGAYPTTCSTRALPRTVPKTSQPLAAAKPTPPLAAKPSQLITAKPPPQPAPPRAANSLPYPYVNSSPYPYVISPLYLNYPYGMAPTSIQTTSSAPPPRQVTATTATNSTDKKKLSKGEKERIVHEFKNKIGPIFKLYPQVSINKYALMVGIKPSTFRNLLYPDKAKAYIQNLAEKRRKERFARLYPDKAKAYEQNRTEKRQKEVHAESKKPTALESTGRWI